LRNKESIIASTVKDILQKDEEERDKKDSIILALFQYVKNLNLKMKRIRGELFRQKNWSRIEENFLKEKVGVLSMDEILTFFKGRRSKGAVLKKIKRLGFWEKWNQINTK